MHLALSSRWLSLAIGMAFCAVALAVFAQASPKVSVRAELILLQNQTGLTLVSFEGAGLDGPVYVVEFASRSLAEIQLLKEKNGGVRAISPDGAKIAFEGRQNTGQALSSRYRTFLGIIRRDGSDLREYPDLDEPYGLCWSPDGLALALNLKNLKGGKDTARGLQVLNLDDGITAEVDPKGLVTSQCWSPNGKQIVYQAGGALQLYDIQANKSQTLTTGQHPTWSPDGKWIAFREDNGFYTVRPSGNDRKLLFKKKDALTPLWWSPDGRFVAYISRNAFLKVIGGLRLSRDVCGSEGWMTMQKIGRPIYTSKAMCQAFSGSEAWNSNNV